MNSNKQLYSDNGIYLINSKLHAGEQGKLLYKGLLAEAGADKVFAYIGYGEEWTDEEYIEMENSEEGFKANFIAKVPGDINICFKDSANNWDNNSGRNYTFEVQKKKISAKAEKEIKKPKLKETKRINSKEPKGEKAKAGGEKAVKLKKARENTTVLE